MQNQCYIFLRGSVNISQTMYVVPPNPLLHQLQTHATQTLMPQNPFSPNSTNLKIQNHTFHKCTS